METLAVITDVFVAEVLAKEMLETNSIKIAKVITMRIHEFITPSRFYKLI